MLSLGVTAALPRLPPDTTLRPPEPEVDRLDWVGTIDDEAHILVVGGGGPGLMCALLRGGAAHVGGAGTMDLGQRGPLVGPHCLAAKAGHVQVPAGRRQHDT